MHREWSSDGIETEILTDDEVKCTTNHLTSFAVLIDHRGLIQQDVSIMDSTLETNLLLIY